MAFRLQFIPGKEPPDLLDLPLGGGVGGVGPPPAGAHGRRGQPPRGPDGASAIKAGDKAELWLDAGRMHLLDPASGENLTRDLLYART